MRSARMKLRIVLLALSLAACAKTEHAPRVIAPKPKPATPAKVCAPAPDRLCPADEAQSDPSFVAYRDQLRRAIDAKDEKALLALIDPDVRTSFGGDAGVDSFRQTFKWDELKTILAMGGSFQEGSFWAPYVFSKWPESSDAFEHVAALHADVPIHAKSFIESPVVKSVDWAILKWEATDDAWAHVWTADGVEGWVETKNVRSPIAYRAGFSKVNGQWRMTALVSGD